jgi:hypothetical protein
MGIAGYVSVCVQLYCMLVSTVFHYMFRPTWPSSRTEQADKHTCKETTKITKEHREKTQVKHTHITVPKIA